MIHLRRGQHYDEDPESIAAALLGAIKKHLDEEDCKHSLREIVEEGLR